MQITPDELLAEAGRMALEIRFKDQAIAALEAKVAELKSRLDTGRQPAAGTAQTSGTT